MRRAIRTHPLAAFFALTFALSWGGLLWLAGGPGGMPATPEEVASRLPLFVLSVLVGPSVSGVVLMGLVDGRPGLRDLRTRLLRWRVRTRWYAMALLPAPLLMTGILLALSLVSPEFLPAVFSAQNRAALVATGTATALGAGIFEELGWTGFAVPKLRSRHGVIETGLIVGVLWALWHVLPAFWLSGAVSGRISTASYLMDPFLFLVAFRVLMVWIHERTQSLLVVMLMHASLTFGARVLTPQGMSGLPLLSFDVAWAGALSAALAALFAADRRQRKRQKPAAADHA